MKRALPLLLVLLSNAPGDEEKSLTPSYSWGLASALRLASVPYAAPHGDPRIDSYILLLYLETPYLFLNGTEGGIRLYRDGHWQFAAYGAMHFVDMPRHDPGYFTDDTVDIGVMGSYLNGPMHTDLLLLSDPARRTHAKLRTGFEVDHNGWLWRPYAAAEYKSSAYNSYYYGQGRTHIDADIGLETGVESRLCLTKTIALVGNAKVQYLGRNTAAADTTDTAFQSEIYLGAGIFQNVKRPARPFNPKGYLRLSFGEATPSSFTETISGQGSRDLHGLYMVSLFYGLPLSKTLFGTRIHTYFTPGFVHHFANGHQPPSQEYVTAFKFFYRPQSWWMRFGFATGLSYITHTTYIEHAINEKDGYDHTSLLMQNLDISFDIELKHLFGKAWKNVWLGYALHHRSGVFASAHQYGQIKGGSNYNTLYLQLHFEE
jgi:MipA family protein